MTSAATFAKRTAGPRRAHLPASEPSLRRVALGPSLGSCREDLQGRLGSAWSVHDLISDVAADPADDVIVLGTEEIAPGRTEIIRRGPGHTVLIGILRGRNTTTQSAEGLQALVDRLTELLRTLTWTRPGRARAA